MTTHDSNGGHSDLWDYIDGNASRLAEAEERIGKLEGHIGELLTRLHDHEQAVPHAEPTS